MIFEKNIVKKNPLQVDIRFASVYPNIYRTAMSSLGYQIIYKMINDREDTWCERVVYPNVRSIESNSPLRDFNIISFSLQYEQDYFNVLKILKNAEIPIKREDRDDSHPLIIAGGPCASSNPLPMSDFVDLFIVGEGEAILNDFLDKYVEIANEKKDKKKNTHKNRKINNIKDNIELFSQIKGIYISKLNNSVERAIVSNMDNAYHITNPIITETSDKEYLPVFGKSILLNVSRGCTRACRFCMSGYIYRPMRETSLQKLLSVVEEARKNTNLKKVSLIGSAVSDYSKIHELIHELLKRGFQISTPSLRIESLNKKILNDLKKSGLQTITLAPESIYHLRKSLNKNITDEKIVDVVKNTFKLGLNLKLYFLIGIPNENKDDIEALGEYIKYLNSLNYEISPNSSMKVSINPLIPKPHTPLQWEGYDIKAIKSKIKYLKHNLKGINVKFESAKLGLIQYVLSCKGSEIGNLLEKSVNNDINLNEWKKYTNSYKINDELPWKNINNGLNYDFLKKERKKSINNEITNWCEINSCYNCGSCK